MILNVDYEKKKKENREKYYVPMTSMGVSKPPKNRYLQS